MTDIRGARIVRMMEDPDLVDDLLLVGLGFARHIDFGGLRGVKLSTNVVADAIWGDDNFARRRIRTVLAGDARTYKPPDYGGVGARCCGAPMIRREGLCGQTSSRNRLLTDWETGEQSWLKACFRHTHWYDEVARENWEAKPDRLVVPAANHGGILARHIPGFAWPKIWDWATDGKWIEHPEVEPWRPPTLTLVLGDGETVSAPRPALPPLLPV